MLSPTTHIQTFPSVDKSQLYATLIPGRVGTAFYLWHQD